MITKEALLLISALLPINQQLVDNHYKNNSSVPCIDDV